ncbi:MAG: cell division protein FtsZ [Gammaproteobacteria bacterium]|nr:cell division protein FtsZ [Gammaproteobacteria bacterium]
MKIEFLDTNHHKLPMIKVVGVGGGGCNAIEFMVRQQIEGVEFIATNTDQQALKLSRAHHVVPIGVHLTRGLGAGANPEIGRKAATEDREALEQALQGADLVFITAGMGGGTGTGAAPVIAEIARSLGALTVAVVTKPFPFEGSKRNQVALKGVEELRQHVDSLITIPNEKLLTVLGKKISLLDAFTVANNVLLDAVQGIANLITKPGLINVDFADIRTVMGEMGHAMMGCGSADGPDRAQYAAERAISSPLLDAVDLSGAKGVLVNITAGTDLTIAEFELIGELVRGFTASDATVIMGTVIDPTMHDQLTVTLVATGLGQGGAAFATRSEALTLHKMSLAKRHMGYPFESQDVPAFLKKRPAVTNPES